MLVRSYQQLIVRTKCLESTPYYEGVDRHGKVGVVWPPSDPSLHIGHLHLCHQTDLVYNVSLYSLCHGLLPASIVWHHQPGHHVLQCDHFLLIEIELPTLVAEMMILG